MSTGAAAMTAAKTTTETAATASVFQLRLNQPMRPLSRTLRGGLAAALADRRLHVELVVVEEAEVELAVRGEPHAVAVAAVGLAHGGDEAHDAARSREAVVPRLVRAVAGQPDERPESLLDPRA